MNDNELWGRWALAAVLSIGCVVACGDDDDDTPGGSAGRGGSAAVGGTGADGGLGGVGGQGGSEPMQLPWCGPLPLEDLCSNATKPCPADVDELLALDLCGAQRGYDSKVTRYDTKCGGTLIVAEYILSSQEWQFDEDGALIGQLLHTDAFAECDGGGFSSSTLFGAKPCEREGAPEVVCTGGGAGGGGAGGSD